MREMFDVMTRQGEWHATVHDHDEAVVIAKSIGGTVDRVTFSIHNIGQVWPEPNLDPPADFPNP